MKCEFPLLCGALLLSVFRSEKDSNFHFSFIDHENMSSLYSEYELCMLNQIPYSEINQTSSCPPLTALLPEISKDSFFRLHYKYLHPAKLFPEWAQLGKQRFSLWIFFTTLSAISFLQFFLRVLQLHTEKRVSKTMESAFSHS